MDAKELAVKMLEWGELRTQADALEAEISAAVMELEKTQTVGNVRASFGKGRTQYDYEASAKSVLGDDEAEAYAYKLWEKAGPTYNWREVCQEKDIDGTMYIKSASGPTVKLKFIY